MGAARLALGVAVLGAGALGIYLVFQRPAPRASATRFTSSEQCRACHSEAWNEWSVSWHAQAWSDPDVRALSNDFANTDCIDCHAPRPVFETGLGNRVLPRESRRAEGVDCIACHELPAVAGREAGVAGTIDRDDVACRPRSVRELARPEFCAPCHDQHKTVEQWRATRYAEQGIGCIECHMPYRGGDLNRGRDHTLHGGHSIELVRAAVAFSARRVDRRVLVTVENTGAGHHFPTDERARAADVFWRPLAPEGSASGPWRWSYRFRSPYRHEVELTDTLLPAHESREITLDDPEAAGAVEVALFYKRTPYWKDPASPDPENEARLVHRTVVPP